MRSLLECTPYLAYLEDSQLLKQVVNGTMRAVTQHVSTADLTVALIASPTGGPCSPMLAIRQYDFLNSTCVIRFTHLMIVMASYEPDEINAAEEVNT